MKRVRRLSITKLHQHGSHPPVKIGEAAKILGVSIDTLRRWEKKGKLSPIYTPGGTRLYSIDNLQTLKQRSIAPKKRLTRIERTPAIKKLNLLIKEETPKSGWEIANHIISDQQQKNPHSVIIPRLFLSDNSSDVPVITEKALIKQLWINLGKSGKANAKIFATVFIPILTLFFLATFTLTASYLVHPQATNQFLSDNKLAGGLLPFNSVSQKLVTALSPPLAHSLWPQKERNQIASSIEAGQVLAAEAVKQYLSINSDTAIEGSLAIKDDLLTGGKVNGVTISSSDAGFTISGGGIPKTLTLTTDTTLNQALTTTSSPTFSSLSLTGALTIPSINLSSSSNQIVVNNSGTTGTLTWVPTSSNKTLTLPNITDTLVTKTSTDTLTNKTIKSGDSNTLSGSFTDISGLGTISTGTWNGTKIGTGYGGTNLTTYTTGDILYASAANTLSKLAIGTAGQSLIVSSGLPAWGSAAATGVTSLDSLTGALTISNTTGSGTTVTIDDATTAAKGIASFSSTNFSVSSGAVSIAANSVGNTQLEYDTGQALTTSSSPSFTGLTVGTLNGLLKGTTGVLGTATAGTDYYNPGGTDVAVADGGTNKSSWTQYAIPYLSNTTTFSEVGIGTSGQVLTVNSGATGYTWTASSGLAGVGDITSVGSMTSGDAFADSTATGDWLGLGSSAGRIAFDDQSTDYVNILSANVGIGTTAPSALLSVGSSSQFQVNSTGGTTIAPTGNSETSLTLRATSGTGSPNILTVTNAAGTSTYMTIDSSGSFSGSALKITDINNAVVGTAIEGAWTMNSNTYTYRRQLTITNSTGADMPANYELRLSLSGSVSSHIYSNTQTDGDDFRIAYSTDGSTFTELARNTTTYSSSSIITSFKTQAIISNSSTNTYYYIYYKNSSLTAGSTFSTNNTVIDAATDNTLWTSSQAGYPLANETTTIATTDPTGATGGTGSIKEGASTVQTGTPGTIGSFTALSINGQLPAKNFDLSSVITTIGGTSYVYVIGGGNGSAGSTVYKSTVDSSSGDLGNFSTTSQGQLPQILHEQSANAVTIGASTYIYVLGGNNDSARVSTVYKATINTTGDIGTFSTTSQGQLPAAISYISTSVATIGSSTYIYVLGGSPDGLNQRSTVYKATIDGTTGDIGTFSTTSQAQLPVTTYGVNSVVTTVGTSTYIYVIGGKLPGDVASTVYKATIDGTTGDIGTFSIASQGQLPAKRAQVQSVIQTIGSSTYLYVLGGYDGGGTGVSTIYKATINGSNGNVGTFATTSQAQLPVKLYAHGAVALTLGSSSYVYVLGGYNSTNITASSTVYKATLDGTTGDMGTLSTGNAPMSQNLYRHTAHTATIGGNVYAYLLGGNSGSAAVSTVYQTTVSSSGSPNTFSTTSQTQLPVTLQQHASELVSLGGTNYIYVLGGHNGSAAVSTAYQTSLNTSTGAVGTFTTTSQGQLPATLQELSSASVTIGGTSYVYAVGGYNGSAGVSTVYKSTISSTNLGTFSTTTQQLPATLYRQASVATTIDGTSYLYVIGGYNGSAAVSTVYKATLTASGDITSAFSTTSQGQLPATLYGTSVFIDTGSIYVLGGTTNGTSAVSTVYKASIDGAGNIGAFSTTSQGQLGASLFGGRAAVSNLSNVPYVNYLGGYTGSAAVSSIYKATVSPTYTMTRTFATPLDWSGKNGLQWYFYSSRTGSYMTLEYSQDGATYTSCNFSVSSASTWELKSCDLSGVANGSKNSIDKIRFRVTDATSAITSYFDNLWAMSTNFSGTSLPSGSSGNASMGASNLAINGQGTGMVQINYDATNSLAGTGGLTVYNGSSTAYFSVASTGKVGIGTTNPAELLHVASGNIRIGAGSLCVKSTDAACAGSTAGAIYASNTTVQAADLAENYISSESLEPGDVVGINTSDVFDREAQTESSDPASGGDSSGVSKTNNQAVVKSTKPYQSSVLGIVSTNPGVTLNSDAATDSAHPNLHPIALAGRVPVKVSTESGPIKAGDYLTSSSIPGVAMKATRPGPVIGKALEAYSCPVIASAAKQSSSEIATSASGEIRNDGSCQGKILAFVSVGFADPLNLLAKLSFDEEGNITVPKLKAGKIILDSSLLNTASSSAQLTTSGTSLALTSSSDTTNYQLPATNSSSYIDLTGKIASLEERIKALENKLASQGLALQGQESTSSAVLAVTSEDTSSASSSATLAQDEATSSSTLTTASLSLTPPELLLSTSSATLANLKVTSDATVSGILTAYQGTFSDTFKSLGKTLLGNTTIAGSFSVDGTMSLSGNSISTLGPLYLQNGPLASSINLFNGKVTIDDSGNIAASTASLNQLKINSQQSAGTVKITTGETSVTVPNVLVEENSIILLTVDIPLTQTPAVTNKIKSQSFTIKLSHTEPQDVTVNYLIVGQN